MGGIVFSNKIELGISTWYDFDFGDWFFGRHVDVWFRPFASRSSEVLLSFVISLLSHIEGSKGVLSPCLPQSVPLLSLVAAVAGTVMSLSNYSCHRKSSFPPSTVKLAVLFLLLFCFSRLAVALSGILLLLWRLMIVRRGDDVSKQLKLRLGTCQNVAT
jgi:hypothetical protein